MRRDETIVLHEDDPYDFVDLPPARKHFLEDERRVKMVCTSICLLGASVALAVMFVCISLGIGGALIGG